MKLLEYRKGKKANFPTLELTKSVDLVIDRFKILVAGKDKAGEFYRKSFALMFAYVSKRIPEISEEFYKIDDAMKAGFGWENGPYEIWDAIGVEKGIELMKEVGKEPAAWVTDMLASGIKSFYTSKMGRLTITISFKKNISKSLVKILLLFLITSENLRRYLKIVAVLLKI